MARLYPAALMPSALVPGTVVGVRIEQLAAEGVVSTVPCLDDGCVNVYFHDLVGGEAVPRHEGVQLTDIDVDLRVAPPDLAAALIEARDEIDRLREQLTETKAVLHEYEKRDQW